MSAISQLIRAVGKSPIFWGILAAAVFYAPFEAGLIQSKFQHRYFAGHPVEYTETVLFFIGLVALALRAGNLAGQYQGLRQPLLPAIPRGGQPPSDCEGLVARLRRVPGRRQDDYLVRRLIDGLEYVARRGSPEGLDDQLKYLAEQDSARMHAEYGLMRLVVWAIPILGFLGTVIGITIAIANLAPDALERSLPEVTSGLGVAFDTTALALGLSIVLMFIQYYVDRAENALLAEVERRAEAELVGRFEYTPAGPDGQAVALRRLGEQLAETSRQLVDRQAELWRASIEAANERWTRMADSAGKHLQSVLTASLAESLKSHAREVSLAEQVAAEKNRQHWSGVQTALVQAAEAIRAMHDALAAKAEVLSRAVEATGQVVRLEEALNRNLSALAGAKNFEQTVISLTAAIHLLTGRLAPLPGEVPVVQLEPRKRTGQAA